MSFGSLLRIGATRGGIPLGLIFAGAGAGVKLLTVLAGSVGYSASVCLFRVTTGCPCMTCGATRALNHLLERDLGGALAMNPLATLAILLLMPWAAIDFLLFLRGRALSVEVSDGLAAILRPLVVVAVFMNWGYLVAVGR